MTAIKVLIVDDSVVVRRVLTRELNSVDDITVVGSAEDPYVARDMIVELNPDVITLDVEMPKMDGITFLQKMMRYRPMPIIIVSSITPKGSDLAAAALAGGAIDVLPKPGPGIGLANLGAQLASKIKVAASINPQTLRRIAQSRPDRSEVDTVLQSSAARRIVAIGASTGGPRAVLDVLSVLPMVCPPLLIVLHMPDRFTPSYARRLNDSCPIEVRQATEGDQLKPGLALLAPGNKHLEVRRSGGIYNVHLSSTEPVNRHRPSVDVLFNSMAKEVGKSGIGVLLTGMGADGAKGLLTMREADANTIIQNADTCVVYGMPKVAAEIGAAEHTLPLGKIGKTIISLTNEGKKRR